MRILDVPPGFLRVLGTIFGLLWGSFLNVVIHRVPRDISVVTPASHCPSCNAPIRPWNNVPVVSWFLMGGRARCCGVKVSPRYPLVELIGGALGLALVETCILQQAGDSGLGRALAVYGATFAVSLALVAAAFIDLDFMYIPDSISLGGAVVGALTATLRGFSLIDAVASSLGAYAVLWGFDRLYKLLRGQSGLGMGDWKLLMLAGAWFGWRGAFFVLFAGSVQGSITAIALKVLGVKLGLPEGVKEELRQLEEAAAAGDLEAKAALEEEMLVGVTGDESLMQSRIAFGPFLILGWFEYLFFGARITQNYDSWLGVFFN